MSVNVIIMSANYNIQRFIIKQYYFFRFFFRPCTRVVISQTIFRRVFTPIGNDDENGGTARARPRFYKNRTDLCPYGRTVRCAMSFFFFRIFILDRGQLNFHLGTTIIFSRQSGLPPAYIFNKRKS